MIDAEIYKTQWKRLEDILGYKLYEGSYLTWKKEIEDNGYNGDRLQRAVDRIILRLSEGNLKPRDVNLGTILGACRAAYTDTTQAQPVMPIDKILDEGSKQASPFAQALIINLKQYLSGQQDKQAWKGNHKAICSRYHRRHYFNF